MKLQLKKLGFSYDWSREIKTSSPSYYKWNQWLFCKMIEKGLAYREKAFVNWSESMQTVLANEQVEAAFCSGKGDDIVQKELTQWFFKITDYAEELLSGLDEIDWPENVKIMQKNWIGRSEGVELELDIPGFDSIKAFTTRLDTAYGITFVSISKSHWFIQHLGDEVKNFVKQTVEDKDGGRGIFTGHYAVNPFNGERVPIYVADYVLDYGTKAVIGVPAHDIRDWEFAQKHGIKVREVIVSEELPNAEKGILTNSDEFDGMTSDKAIEAMLSKMSHLGLASKKVNYRLKDWLISRQRYWGTPIPIKYENGIELDRELPVELPEDVEFSGSGNPIKTSKSFGDSRETDTMDTFVDSSWYYLRYLDSNNEREIFDGEIEKHWPQIDLYIGGVEHAVMHLLYARFIHRVMSDLGLTTKKEPFKRLLTQGMVLSNSYYNKRDNKYYFPKDLPENLDDFDVKMEKMSKSKNNGVAPEEMADKYGVDAVRIFILFAAPPERDLEWNEKGIAGAARFLNRVHQLVEEFEVKEVEEDSELLRKLHYTIDKVTNVMETNLHFNVAIAALMELLNTMYEKRDFLNLDALMDFLKLLSPFAPHISDHLLQKLGGQFFIKESWPEVDNRYLKREVLSVPIQVNGKHRGVIEVNDNMEKEQVLTLAKEAVSKYINGNIKKEIYVTGKIINFVV